MRGLGFTVQTGFVRCRICKFQDVGIYDLGARVHGLHIKLEVFRFRILGDSCRFVSQAEGARQGRGFRFQGRVRGMDCKF